jgi:hypothetical protein
VSEQNRSLQVARIKQLLGPELDRELFHRIAPDLLLDGSLIERSIERSEQF